MNRAAKPILSVRIVMLLLLLPLSSGALAYDVKTYLALNGGVAKLDYDVRDYRQLDSTDEAYELTVGWDVTTRVSVEMSWSDLGDFDYRGIGDSSGRDERISLVSYRLNGVFYLFSSDGLSGLRDRIGFSGFLKLGAGRTENRQIFSALGNELDDAYISVGLGVELGLNRSTYFRFQVQSFDDDLVYGSAAIMWRWGRNISY